MKRCSDYLQTNLVLSTRLQTQRLRCYRVFAFSPKAEISSYAAHRAGWSLSGDLLNTARNILRIGSMLRKIAPHLFPL